MTRFASTILLMWLCARAGTLSAGAHELPLSFIDLRIERAAIEATIETSARNFSHDLPGVDEGTLLSRDQAEKYKYRLEALLKLQFHVSADGKMLEPEIWQIESLPERKDVRLLVRYPGQVVERIEVRSELFAFEPSHKIFLNLYRQNKLEHQGIFSSEVRHLEYAVRDPQTVRAVVRQFVGEGVHHIFIGPDHILFLVGLLLLGGGLGTLLRIVTAFTVAHSITLVLAATAIVSLPARVIEPVIALSIVVVGAHALFWHREKRDWRLLVAFGFGFIHGFGFANVLREMELPRVALGWSLVSFNVGVEIGQACIVLAVAPALAILQQRRPLVAARVIQVAAVGVMLAGGYWFAQRAFYNG